MRYAQIKKLCLDRAAAVMEAENDVGGFAAAICELAGAQSEKEIERTEAQVTKFLLETADAFRTRAER